MKVVKGTNVVDGIAWFYSIVNGEATIVSPTGEFGVCAVSPKPTGKVSIPSSFDGAPVTAIGDHAFRYCREMKEVKIPASVRGNVFDKCENLAAIHVPANAKSWKGMKKWQGIPLVFDTVAK